MKVKKIFKKNENWAQPQFLLDGEGLHDENTGMVHSVVSWVRHQMPGMPSFLSRLREPNFDISSVGGSREGGSRVAKLLKPGMEMKSNELLSR